MNKSIILRISCLFVIVLFMCTIGPVAGWAEFPFLSVRASETPANFTATVDGTSVDFDWTAMPDANSYTMAVALTDVSGNVDMGTLKLLEMGDKKTFSTIGLPSGMIFHAAILAYSTQGLVVSNSLKFMPFAGVTTYPEAGDVLMQLDDPGGIGSMTVYGSRNGDEIVITRITGDDGTGPFVLTFVGDDLISMTKGGLTINFSGLARSAETLLDMPSQNRSGLASEAECQERVNIKGRALDDEFVKKRDSIDSATLLLKPGKEVVEEDKFRLGGGSGFSFLDALGKKIDKKISRLTRKKKELIENYKRDNAKLIEEFEECSKVEEPSEIIIDLSCPVPAGAEYSEINYGTSIVKQYLLNGEIVGPWRWWGLDAGAVTNLKREACKNAAGQLNGWAVSYYENGNMADATLYKDGVKDGHDYIFYCSNGSVYRDLTYVNGTVIYSETYYENGSLCCYCDCAGDGIGHVVGKDTLHSPECE